MTFDRACRSALFVCTMACLASRAPSARTATAAPPPLPAQGVTAKLLSSHGCGRATGYAETNKIVTVGSKTHVAWLDSTKGGFRVRIRTLDRTTGTWSPTYTVGEAYDNHGGPALAVDSRGYLHIAYYPHHHPMRYRRSLRPNDASAWTEVAKVGRRTTYPTLVVGPDDTLYLTCRESGGKQWLANLYTKPPGKGWQGPRAILRSQFGGYAHFQEALAWGPPAQAAAGRHAGQRPPALHLSCRIYEGPKGLHRTVGYLRSDDGGVTWRKADGTTVALPATSETIDVIASTRDQATRASGQSLRCGAIAVDPAGRPVVLYSTLAGEHGRLLLARADRKGTWTRRPLLVGSGRKSTPWSAKMPGGLTITPDGRLWVVATFYRPDQAQGQTLWGHASSEVGLLVCDGEGTIGRESLLSKVDAKRAHWLANIERPTGHNLVALPCVLYTAGPPGGKNTDTLANDVIFVRP